jgi:hypothetical protein
MIRRVFTILSVLSLVLCVATCVLWVRSYWVGDVWVTSTAPGGLGEGWASVDGRFGRMWAAVDPPTGTRVFVYRDGGGTNVRGGWWFAPWAAAFGLTPIAWVWSRRVAQSLRPAHTGLFPACGYDLRASPDRCPECGAVPAAKGVA